jgi:hypothetical protein
MFSSYIGPKIHPFRFGNIHWQIEIRSFHPHGDDYGTHRGLSPRLQTTGKSYHKWYGKASPSIFPNFIDWFKGKSTGDHGSGWWFGTFRLFFHNIYNIWDNPNPIDPYFSEG